METRWINERISSDRWWEFHLKEQRLVDGEWEDTTREAQLYRAGSWSIGFGLNRGGFSFSLGPIDFFAYWDKG